MERYHREADGLTSVSWSVLDGVDDLVNDVHVSAANELWLVASAILAVRRSWLRAGVI